MDIPIFLHKPIQYIGNEVNSIHKDWDTTKVKFVISYPDLYEIGMSCLAIQIIYYLLNSYKDVLCERVFMPENDAQEWLKKNNIPLFSLESHRPINEFDCIGFSLQHELNYTNILKMLELSNIPLHKEEREFPIIIGGGPCAFNPLPLIDFFDLFVIGEIEPILPQFVNLFINCKSRAGKINKKELLQELSKLDGVFVPGINKYVKRQWASELKNEYSYIVPFIQIERDCLIIEMARGCPKWCKFCQPGMTTKPYREKDLNSIFELVNTGIRATGYNEVSLLSFCADSHSQIIEVIKRIKSMGINVSLPSIRAENLTEELAKLICRGGITIAPETGTERLRNYINKPIKDEQIFNACEIVAKYPFTHLKLYFMVGLPTEEEKDIKAIIDMLYRIGKILNKNINVSISPFIPRAHTPFQWEKQEEVKQKMEYIKNKVRKSNIKIKCKNTQSSMIEGIFARGDEKLSKVIKEAYILGAQFDSWDDKFDFSIWDKAFNNTGIDPQDYLKAKDKNNPLPWDIIDTGIKKEFLIKESVLDCATMCVSCGVCSSPIQIKKETKIYGRYKKIIPTQKIKLRYRIKYEKGEELRLLGHIDLTRAIIRAIIRANIPIVFSGEFTKRAEISFSPPLPFGITSKEEYFDIFINGYPLGDIKFLLNKNMPKGIKILSVSQIWGKANSLFDEFKHCVYRAKINIEEDKIYKFIQSKEAIFNGINIRPYVVKIEKDNEYINLFMKIGKVKPHWVIHSLAEVPEVQLNIERIKLLP